MGARVTLRRDLSGSLFVNYERRHYDGVDQFFRLLSGVFTGTARSITRRDHRVFLRAAVDWEVSPELFLTPSYQFSNSNSTLPTADFDRHVGMITLRKVWR